MAFDDTVRIIRDSGKAKGLKIVQVPRVQEMFAKGMSVQEISDKLLVDPACIESFVPKPEVAAAAKIREAAKSARKDN